MKKNKKNLICLVKGHEWYGGYIVMPSADGTPEHECHRCGLKIKCEIVCSVCSEIYK